MDAALQYYCIVLQWILLKEKKPEFPIFSMTYFDDVLCVAISRVFVGFLKKYFCVWFSAVNELPSPPPPLLKMCV